MNTADEHEAFLDFLHSVRNARKAYTDVLARFASIDSACKRITPSWSTDGGHSGDSQSLWAERADEATRVQRAKDAVDSAVLALEALIEQVPDKTHRSILRRRYVRCLPWPSICAMLPMSERSVYRAHRQALKAAEELWNESKGGHHS
jgi:DNA-directed RNA polymerase specialized sigma24 family protein